VMLPSLWFASTKPEAALDRSKAGLPLLRARWTLALRDRGPEAGVHCR
jgi:hypothetical protein